MVNQSETNNHISYCGTAKSHITHVGTHEHHPTSSSPGAELGGAKGGYCPPKILPGLPKFFRSLSESPTQTIDSSPCCKTGSSSGPPNENVWLRPCSSLKHIPLLSYIYCKYHTPTWHRQNFTSHFLACMLFSGTSNNYVRASRMKPGKEPHAAHEPRLVTPAIDWW